MCNLMRPHKLTDQVVLEAPRLISLSKLKMCGGGGRYLT